MKKLKLVSKSLLKLVSLLFLLALSFVYAMFQGGFDSWFLFAAFLPIAAYSLMLLFYPMKKIKVERFLNQAQFNAGDSVVVEIRVTLPNRFPLFYLLVEDLVPPKLVRWSDKPNQKLLLSLFKKELVVQYEIERIPRGEYVFHGFDIRVSDLFGLVEKASHFSKVDSILVYPSYVNLRYEPFENQFEQGATVTKDKVQRDTTMAISVRDYQPGDRFSWINWKATARKNEIMTKEFEQRQSHDLLLVLDRSQHENFELAVTFSASVIRAVLKKGAQIGLYSFGQEPERLPVRGGEAHQETLFHYLAGVEDDATVDLSQIIAQEKTFHSQFQAILFVVCSLDRTVLEEISAIGTRKGKVALFLIKQSPKQVDMFELNLLELAKQRGITAKLIYEGEFSRAFVRGEAV